MSRGFSAIAWAPLAEARVRGDDIKTNVVATRDTKTNGVGPCASLLRQPWPPWVAVRGRR